MVMDSHPPLPQAPRRVSRSPASLCRRAPSPHTPDGPMRARARCFRIGRRLQHLRKRGHRQWVHEAESGSLALGLASSLSSLVSDLPRGSPPRDRPASRPWLPADAGPKLHGERAIHMADTSQSAREMSVTGTPKIRRFEESKKDRHTEGCRTARRAVERDPDTKTQEPLVF